MFPVRKIEEQGCLFKKGYCHVVPKKLREEKGKASLRRLFSVAEKCKGFGITQSNMDLVINSDYVEQFTDMLR